MKTCSGFWAAAMVLVSASTVRAEIIAGTFRYLDSNGYRPIAFCNVEVWAFRARGIGIWTWAHENTITTDANGAIYFDRGPTDRGVVYGLRVMATNYAAVVWPNDVVHTVPFHREPGEPDGVINRTVNNPLTDVLDFSWDFKDDFAPQHYNLAEMVRRGHDYVSARRDPMESDPLPRANVQPTSVTGSWHNPSADTVVITTGHVFEDFVILHEYGHFVQEQLSSFAWIASSHDGCFARDIFGSVINSPEHAWLEGFADCFAMAVSAAMPAMTPPLHGTADVGTPSVAWLETPGACSAITGNITPDMVEMRVAGVLWDLTDGGTAESWDTLSGYDTAIMQIMDRELDTPKWPTISDFRAAWRARGLPSTGLDQIMGRLKMALDGVPADPDLVVQRVAASVSAVAAGGSFVAEDTTANVGTYPTEVITFTRFYLSSSPTAGTGTVVLGDRAVEDVCPGCVSNGSTVLTVPASVAPGIWYLQACADATGVLAETVEQRNCAEGPAIEIRPSSPTIACFQDDFSKAGGAQTQWTAAAGSWNVSAEALEAKANFNEESWIWAGAPPVAFTQTAAYEFDFEFLAGDSDVGRHGGVMFCTKTPSSRMDAGNHGYTLDWIDRPDDRGLRLIRWDQGKASPLHLGTPQLEKPPSRWKIETTAKEILCYADNTLLIKIQDSNYRGGLFGAWAYTGVSVAIDNVVVGSDCTTPPAGGFRRGDANSDARIDIADGIYVLTHLFAKGAAPRCQDTGDANDDGKIDIADAIKILSHLFSHAGPLPAPFGICGADRTQDLLGCAEYRPCE